MKCHRSSKIRNQYQKINTLSFKRKHVFKTIDSKINREILGRLFFLTWHKFAVAAAKIYRKQKKINIKSANKRQPISFNVCLKLFYFNVKLTEKKSNLRSV